MLTNLFLTMLQITRSMDGRVFNTATGLWEPATPESLQAADTAIMDIAGAGLDQLAFPMAFSVPGLLAVNIDRPQADQMVARVTTAVRAYVTATTK